MFAGRSGAGALNASKSMNVLIIFAYHLYIKLADLWPASVRGGKPSDADMSPNPARVVGTESDLTPQWTRIDGGFRPTHLAGILTPHNRTHCATVQLYLEVIPGIRHNRRRKGFILVFLPIIVVSIMPPHPLMGQESFSQHSH